MTVQLNRPLTWCLCLFLLSIAGCGGAVHAAPLSIPAQGTLELGSDSQLPSFTLSQSQSAYTVSGTHTVLDGLTIAAPNGGLLASQTITLHYATIKSHTFGPLINPKTPFIYLEAPNMPTGEYLRLIFPMAVASSSAVTAVYYDSTSQSLTPLDTGVSPPNVEVLVTQFAPNSSKAANGFGGFFLTIAGTADLGNGDTLFKIGQDNCPFPNYGSAVTPGGQCLGMTVLTSWYFDTPRSINSPLFQLLDDYGGSQTPSFWPDDNLGIRLSCQLQNEANEPSAISHWWSGNWTDASKYAHILYGIAIQHKPQLIELWHDSDTGPEGHAVLAYKVSGGTVLVADPNYPSNSAAQLVFNGHEFSPYVSSETLGSPGTTYEKVLVTPRTSFLSDQAVSSSWGAITSAGNDIFSTYEISALANGSLISADATGTISCPSATISFQPSGEGQLEMSVFNAFKGGSQPLVSAPDLNGRYDLPNALTTPDSNGFYNVNLGPGANQLGVVVWKETLDPFTNEKVPDYVDFRYITVNQTTSTSLWKASFSIQCENTPQMFEPATVSGWFVYDANTNDVTSSQFTFSSDGYSYTGQGLPDTDGQGNVITPTLIGTPSGHATQLQFTIGGELGVLDGTVSLVFPTINGNPLLPTQAGNYTLIPETQVPGSYYGTECDLSGLIPTGAEAGGWLTTTGTFTVTPA